MQIIEYLKTADLELFKMIGAIAFLLIGNTICGAAKANKYKEFDWKVLLEGLIKYALILLAVICFFCAGLLLPTFEAKIPVFDETLTIIKILKAIGLAICGRYVYSMWQNLKDLFGLADEDFKKELTETTYEK